MSKVKEKWNKLIDVIDRFDDIEDERKVETSMYKIRWVWYHTILGVELLLVILLLFGIYLKL
jgi:hypothetical protein